MNAKGATTDALPKSSVAARVALSAVAGPVLFTAAWIVLGAMRVGYSPVASPVSALGIGRNGILMDAAFVVSALLIITGVIAAFQSYAHAMGKVARWMCEFLLVISPLGMLWAGIFTMNTLRVHLLFAQVALGSPVIAFPAAGLIARRVSTWRRFGTWMLLGGPLTLFLVFALSRSQQPSQTGNGNGSYGLWERALILEVQAWYAATGLLAYRRFGN